MDGAEVCLDQGCSMVVVTLGKGHRLDSRGKTVTATSYIRNTETEYITQSPPQDVAFPTDTTGAGDAFASGFLYGLLKGKSPEECGRLGDIIAQFAIGKIGAREGFPTLDQLSQRYQELYHQRL